MLFYVWHRHSRFLTSKAKILFMATNLPPPSNFPNFGVTIWGWGVKISAYHINMRGIDRHRICFFVFAGSKKCTRNSAVCIRCSRVLKKVPISVERVLCLRVQKNVPATVLIAYGVRGYSKRCRYRWRGCCVCGFKKMYPRWFWMLSFYICFCKYRMTAQGAIANC